MRKLVIVGLLSSVLWLSVTLLTWGVPAPWRDGINVMTGGAFREYVGELANGFYYDVANNDMPTAAFLLIFTLLFGLYFRLVTTFRPKDSLRNVEKIIVSFAILFRLILIPGEMIHENDIYRFLWDGKVLNAGINPYQYAPDDVFLYEHKIREDYYDEKRDVTLKERDWTSQDKVNLEKLAKLRKDNPVFFERIGHRQVPTIYPPLAQAVFGTSAWVRPDSILFLKFIFVLFDIGVIFILLKILHLLQMNPALSVIYAWSPLVLKEFANSGHYDSIPIFFIMLGVYGYLWARPLGCSVAVAMAILTKFFAVVLLPFFRWKISGKSLLIMSGMIGFSYLAFDQIGEVSWGKMFTGLFMYHELWSYNSSIFAVVHALWVHFSPWASDSLMVPKLITGVMYGGVLCYLALRRENSPQDFLQRIFGALGWLFLFSAVGDPWYFCWSIPFLCFSPSRAWLILSWLLTFSYLNFYLDISLVKQVFFHIPLMNWLIYGPFFVILAFEFLAIKKGRVQI